MIHNPEIRQIIPPDLAFENLSNPIYCYRASRCNGPHMDIAYQDQKIIAHNYGHTRSGWSLGPGSAQYMVDLFIKQIKKSHLQKDIPIAVIGAGALGLFTAYFLKKSGYHRIKIIAEKFDHSVSHHAGGLFIPPAVSTHQEITKHITVNSYQFYWDIAHQRHRDFSNGAVIMPAYFKKVKVSYTPLLNKKIIQPPKNIVLDFGNGVRRAVVAYDESIFIDVATMITNLHTFLKKHASITFEQKKIVSFDEVDERCICNCSGLGAVELNQDHTVVASQGHFMLLKKQNPENLNYMISFPIGNAKTSSGQIVQYSCNFYPKRLKNEDRSSIGVIGGTFIRGATERTPNHEQIPIIWRNARAFFYGCD